MWTSNEFLLQACFPVSYSKDKAEFYSTSQKNSRAARYNISCNVHIFIAANYHLNGPQPSPFCPRSSVSRVIKIRGSWTQIPPRLTKVRVRETFVRFSRSLGSHKETTTTQANHAPMSNTFSLTCMDQISLRREILNKKLSGFYLRYRVSL